MQETKSKTYLPHSVRGLLLTLSVVEVAALSLLFSSILPRKDWFMRPASGVSPRLFTAVAA